MSGLVDRLLAVQGPLLYALVAAVVFVEDALFVGFVVPGETAAVLGGVTASLGHASLPVMMVTVAAAAIIGAPPRSAGSSATPVGPCWSGQSPPPPAWPPDSSASPRRWPSPPWRSR